MILHKTVAIGGLGQWDAHQAIDEVIRLTLGDMERERVAVYASTGKQAQVEAHLMSTSMVSHEKSILITVIANVLTNAVKDKQ